MNNYPDIIRQVIARKFTFKGFQLEDYAKAALHDGCILGHDTGGGKGLALYVWPCLKVGFERGVKSLIPKGAVLLIAPGDLHKQVMDEGRDKFHAKVTPIDTQETFLRLSTINPSSGRRQLPPGFYITSYTQLGTNGIADFPEFKPGNPAAMMEKLNLTEKDIEIYFNQKAIHLKHHYARLAEYSPCGSDSSATQLRAAWQAACRLCPHLRQEFDDAYAVVKHFAGSYAKISGGAREFVCEMMLRYNYNQFGTCTGETKWVDAVAPTTILEPGETPLTDALEEYISGTEREKDTLLDDVPGGLPRLKIKCVYSPSLADLCSDTFDCVAVDEGVKMKGEDTLVGLGVRQMNPRYRLLLTATPIKNRLPDIFRLAWWAAGGHEQANARWPYPDASSARDQFAEEFLISERNLSKQGKSESSRRYLKLTPQVCNVHRLWKLLAPVVLRRRKKDFGEDIVAKHRHIVRVPMGTHQSGVYQYHLRGEYLDKKLNPCIGPQLQALRIAAANPASELLTLHPSPQNTALSYKSQHTYIPKLHAALKLIHQVMERGEQVVVFSAFHDSLDVLSARLNEAGITHIVADGRMSQTKRGEAIKRFKQGGPRARMAGLTKTCSYYPVLLAGVESVAEGHSMDLCNNVILMCYSWAYDRFEQAINRAHRLNSPWDVNVFPIICDGSIDRKLEALIQEKGDAAELVLDGHLLGEHTSEVNLAELLSIARAEFTGKNTVDEAILVQQWPALRAELAVAMKNWKSLAHGMCVSSTSNEAAKMHIPPAKPALPPAMSIPSPSNEAAKMVIPPPTPPAATDPRPATPLPVQRNTRAPHTFKPAIPLWRQRCRPKPPATVELPLWRKLY
jgi:SNF2 domain-containing protein/helicase-like protein